MKTTWKDYQKDIADDRYYYARSCIRQNFFPGFFAHPGLAV